MHKDFAKAYQGFFTGTIRDERPTVRLVFLGLIFLADDAGFVTGTDAFIASFINVTLPAFQEAINRLNEPDEHSTTPDEEGRRVLRLGPNRYQVVNYLKYYDLGRTKRDGTTAKTPAERMKAMRERRREAQGNPLRDVTDKEKEKETKGKNKKKKDDPEARAAHLALYEDLLKVYPVPLPSKPGGRPRDLQKAKGRELFLNLLKAGESAEAIMAGVAGYAEYIGEEEERRKYVKQITTFLSPSARTWEEYGPVEKKEEHRAAAIALKGQDVPEPEEGVDFETREVPFFYRGRQEWGVASLPFIPGTEDAFDLPAWRLAKAAELNGGDLGL